MGWVRWGLTKHDVSLQHGNAELTNLDDDNELLFMRTSLISVLLSVHRATRGNPAVEIAKTFSASPYYSYY